MKASKNLPYFNKNIIALAAAAVFLPSSALALEFVQEPPVPKSTSTYVAPNIILSLDDSTSMNEKDMIKNTKTRTAVLKEALKAVFEDKILLKDKSIRFAWQSMSDCTKINNKKAGAPFTADSAKSTSINTMRILDETHRNNFLTYAENFSPCGSTPTHFLVKGADEYMRAELHQNGPWADIPGKKLASSENNNKPLGCRRNYHIMLTDGDWNGQYYRENKINTSPVNFDNQDTDRNIHGKEGTSNKTEEFPSFKLPDDTPYRRSDPNTWVYRDIDLPTWSSWHNDYEDQYISTISDWSFKSWAEQLQNPSELYGKVPLSPDYLKAPSTEEFKNPKTNKTATLDKYWNPRYNPATWPHMVTYTIGFSNDSIPKNQYRPIGTDNETTKNIGRYWIDKKIFDKWYDKKDGLLWQFDGPYLSTSSNANTNNGNKGKLIPPSSNLPYGFDGSFADYAAGRAQWYSVKGGEAGQDMWHAAINGRGRFYAVEKGEDLKKAFEEIINTINYENAPLPGEVYATNASSSYSLVNNNAGIYIAGYSPKDSWRGWVQASSAVQPEEVTCGTLEEEFVPEDDAESGANPTTPAPEKCVRFPSKVEGWEGKTTAERLDDLTDAQVKGSSRLILGWNDKTNSGALFKWSNDDETYMSNSQKALLGKLNNIIPTPNIEEKGENILNYIRGEKQYSDSEPESIKKEKPFRKRTSRQGDIVNSEIWYTEGPISNYSIEGYKAYRNEFINREPMLYVGGNDGMLHGFSAKDGTEKIAYIPRGVLSKLKDLTDPEYINKHQYYVDGSPMTGDVKTGTGSSANDWKTMLVGTLGAGGKGYFVLDVSNPLNFQEGNASSLVILDKTFSKNETTTHNDTDIGYITAPPVRRADDPNQTTQIAKMNNGRWAVIMGNGYNSYNQRPALLIQYLDGDKSLFVLPATGDTKGTGKANDNGLSAPALVDIDGNRTPDIAYAGDNQGNMWKFDLLSDNVAEWKVAFGGEPLFTAKGPLTKDGTREKPQPITVPPSVRANNRTMLVDIGGGEKKTISVGGMMVAFGTGRNLTESDRSTTNTNYGIQSVYSILDNTRYKKVDGKVKEYSGDGGCTHTEDVICIPEPKAVGTMGADGVNLSKIIIKSDGTLDTSDALTKSNWSVRRGWYADFPVAANSNIKERVLKPSDFYLGTEILEVRSIIPESTTASDSIDNESVESCSASSVSVNNGKEYVTYFNLMDGQAPAFQILGYLGNGIFDPSMKGKVRKEIPRNSHKTIETGDGARIHDGADGGGAPVPEQSMRPSWRQIK